MSQPSLRKYFVSTFRTASNHRLLLIIAVVMLGVSGLVISKSFAFKATASRLAAQSPASGQESGSRVRTKKSADLLEFAGLRHTAAAPTSLASVLAPTVAATKTDSLFTDVDGDTQADPGDTLKYTVNISASGENATGVSFTDTVDPNTTFVPGSLTATPVAVDDSYAALGNVRISVPAPGVLGNDFAGVPSATISGAPSSFLSTNGGNVALNADGSFTYNPPAGFEGTDTFTYTLTNSAGSNSATVTITVSGMIWFVNNTASCPCDGRLTNPFNTLAAFAAVNNGAGNNPAANDNIFLYESAIDYIGTVTLLNGQRFIGQDATASLSAITGLTPPPYSDPLPVTNSGNATIVNVTSASTAITVASGNTLVGFTGGDAVTDISGTGFGTLTVSDVTLNGTGQALNLTAGTLAATFGSISSTNSSTTGISLSGVAGSLTSPTTTITNPAGIGVSVDTSGATLDFGNTTSTGSGGTGVSLLTNTGTISFGALNITPDASQRGLLATDNSNTVTSTSGAITTSGATAVEITRGSGTTPLVVSLTSVTANGGANGIKLSNTNGSFTVTGDGASDPANTTRGRTTAKQGGGTVTLGSGGTISNTTGAGVSLNNTTNVTLRNLSLTGNSGGLNSGADGINAANSSSLTLDNVLVMGHSGNDGLSGSVLSGLNLLHTDIHTNAKTAGVAALDIWNVRLNNLTGTCAVTNSLFFDTEEDVFAIINSGSSNLTLTVTNSEFRDTSPAVTGNVTFAMLASGSSVTTLTATGSTFKNARTTGFQYAGNNTSSGTVKVMNSVFGGTAAGGDAANQNGVDVDIAHQGAGATLNFEVSGNTTRQGFKSTTSNSINVFLGGLSTSTSQMIGTVKNNVVGIAGTANSGSNLGAGIALDCSGAGTMTTSVLSNTINQVKADSGNVFDASTSQTAKLNLRIRNNTLNGNPLQLFPLYGLHINAGTGSPGENNQLCIDMGANSVIMPATAVASVGLDSFSGTTQLVGYTGLDDTGGGTDGGQIENFLGSSPISTPPGANTITTPAPLYIGAGGITKKAVSPCSSFVFPSIVSPAAPPLEQLSENSGDSANSAGVTIESETQSEDTLRATWGEAPKDESGQKLTPEALAWVVQAALERWRQSGSSPEDLMRLQAMKFEVADLPDGELASATMTSIKIDETGAGYGWYLDLTPIEDEEFNVPVPGRERQTTEDSPAIGRMDLLTVVTRELGVAKLQGKSRIPKQMQPLMQNTLSPAVRRLPDSRNIQLPGSTGRVPGKARPSGETSLVSQVSRGSALQSKAGVSRSEVSTRSTPAADKARGQSSGLMHHAPMNRTTAASLSTMVADVMLSIGTLPAGESVTVTFKVTVNDPFTGAMAQVSNQGTVSGSNFADVLTDDPDVGGTADPTVTPIDLPKVTVAVSPSSVLEDGGTNLVYTFTRSGSTAAAMTVNFNVAGSTASATSDYSVSGTGVTFNSGAGTGTVQIPAGSTTATVTVDPSADTTVEPDETVVVNVTSGSGYSPGTPSTATGTITNDDTDVTLAVSPASVSEDGATNLVYTFTRNGVTAGALTVNFSIGGTANFGASPNDYTQTGATSFTPPTGTVTFGAGSSTATVTINPETDTTVEPDETVVLTVTSGAGYNVGLPNSATGTITNDDADVSVAVSPASVAEDGATNLVYTFTRTGFTANAVTVNFSVGGTASFTEPDYSQTGAATFSATSGTVNFGAGSTTATVTIDPATDSTPEPDETVVLTVTSGAGYNVGSPSSATGTIDNDDTVVTVAVSPLSVAEGGSNLVYTFTRTGVTASSLTVNFSIGGTASSGSDYTQTGATTFTPPTGTVTFGAGSSTAAVNVTPLSDCDIEGPETVQFTVTAGTGYSVGSPSSATGTITNTAETTPPVISGVSADPSTLSPPNHTMRDVTINYTATDNCGAATCVISNITSNEPVIGSGSGNTAPDWEFVDEHHVRLRSEREGSGDGRIYTITITCTDSVGNTSSHQVTVTVP